MSNDLAVISQEELDALAKRTGAVPSGKGDFIPQLKVNYEEDSDEDDAPKLKGKLFITGTDTPVYAKSVTFRPLTHHYQWTKYDKLSEKVTNRTRIIADFDEEARDELGTIRCGKPTSKEIKANPALKAKYDDITCYRQVQGIASYDGIDKDGNAASVEDTVVSLRLKGANFSPFQEEYREMLKGDPVWDHELTLTTTREKNGASTYYVIHFDADLNDRKALTRPLFDTALGLQERIEEVNKEIDMKYFDAVSRKTEDDEAMERIKTVSSARPGMNRGLKNDLNDDIPF